MGLFSFGSNKRVVITFSDTVIRGVTVQQDKQYTMRVVRSIEQRIPSGMISEGVIEQPKLFVELLKSFARKLPSKRVHVLVPQEAALIVPLVRPEDSEKNIKENVLEQLEDILTEHPGPKEGYEVLSIVDDGHNLFVDTVSASLIETYKNFFKKAGLHVISWDTPHPDWVTLPYHEEQSHIMVGVGERATSVVFLNGGVPVMKSMVPVGHADLVDTVRDVLQIQTHEAQKIVARYGVGLEHKEERVLHALYDTMRPLEVAINTMIDEWKRKPYKNARERFPIASLLTHGQTYTLPGFNDRMSHTTRVPAQHIDIADMLDIPDIARVMSRDEMIRFAPLLWKAHELVRA